ncbi:MAG: hypothetical protein HFJ47_03250 [Clostridia bacterium]|nr:hypothetical protein [Clostridia bacterium]
MKLQKISLKFIVSLLLSMLVICQLEFNLSLNVTNANQGQQIQQEQQGQVEQKQQPIQQKAQNEQYQQTVKQDSRFDLSLRKVITQVKDKEGNTKEIVNEVKQIATRKVVVNKDNEKLIYKHRKDPILVEKGDIVIYTITIYNQGKEEGYATKIVDQLPGTPTTGLRLLNTKEVKSTSGNIYMLEYSTATNIATFTLKSTNPKTIPAFNGTQLSKEEIILECQVMADINTKESTILTNIAYIEEAYNKTKNKTVRIYENEDSKTSTYPVYQNEDDTKQDGITYGDDIGYIGDINNLTDLTQDSIYYRGQKDCDDFEKLIISPQIFDLSLRQVVTEVDGISTDENRKIKITGLDELQEEDAKVTTAQYNHVKTPVIVKNGSKVIYNINIYNEASIDGIASIIKNQLPIGLRLNLSKLSTQLIDGKTQYYIITEKGNKYIVQYDEIINNVTFKLDTSIEVTNIKAMSKRETLDFDTLEFECIVQCVANEEKNTYLTNISYIYEQQKADGTIITSQKGEDRDSEPHTIPLKTAQELKTINDIGYIGSTEISSDLGQEKTYYKGEQDDDDFEKLVILPQVFDLKLIQYVDEINKEDTGERIIKVDTSSLNQIGRNGEQITTAEYEIEKNPVSVKELDFVKYTFRVYNEGDYDGYATEISESIPEGLEALMIGKDTSNNIIIYSWDGLQLKDVTEEIKATDMYNEVIDTNSIWGYNANNSIIKTTSLKEEVIKAFGNKEYKDYADKENKIDYKETSVIFRVKEGIASSEKPIVAESAITSEKAVNENGEEVIDLEGNRIKDRDSNWNQWKREYSGAVYNKDQWKIYKEDDEDYDNIIVREFNLKLRQFIIENKDINEPLTVHVGDIVTYTTRVYNEGKTDGYAQEITNNIPEYLEYLPHYEINQKYEWKMYDEEGNETEDAKKAVKIKTNYLAKGEGKEKEENNQEVNLIKGLRQTSEEQNSDLDYKDVKVAFKLKDLDSSEHIISSLAQISEITDREGKPIKDMESQENNEELQVKEENEYNVNIKVQCFDLALTQYLTKVIIIENGEQQVTNTGNIGNNNDIIPEVEIDKDRIQQTVLKFVYKIKITNEGDIAGYAKKITDYIPSGLQFNAEDNPNWAEENGIISTQQLEKELLQPGESSDIEIILTWVNDDKNLGTKTNVAEISEYYNDKGIKDKDSMPNNKNDTEDDIDIAEVTISIKTIGGIGTIYVNLILVLCAVIIVGVFLIKLFVL